MSRNDGLDHLERSFQLADAEFGLDLEQGEHVTACAVREDIEVWVHAIYIRLLYIHASMCRRVVPTEDRQRHRPPPDAAPEGAS